MITQRRIIDVTSNFLKQDLKLDIFNDYHNLKKNSYNIYKINIPIVFM
jgi:hypothetical protein